MHIDPCLRHAPELIHEARDYTVEMNAVIESCIRRFFDFYIAIDIIMIHGYIKSLLLFKRERYPNKFLYSVLSARSLSRHGD